MSEQGKSRHLTRRLVLGGLLGSAAGHAIAGAPQTSIRPVPRGGFPVKLEPPRSVEDLLAEAGLSGQITFAVAEAGSGKILEARNPVLGLPPASVTKSITALYALEKLGPAYRFRTQLVATGPVQSGKLNGDLVLIGGGDPTLDTDALGDMAQQLKAAGVREVTGKFLVWSGGLPAVFAIDPEQPEHVGYNPAVSGLNLNYNRVHFEWKRESGGYSVSMDARATRFKPAVAISRMRVVDRTVPVYTYANDDGADQWTVARGALGNGGSRWLPVRRPELYAAEVFQTLARSHGIVLPRARPAGSRPAGKAIVEHASDDLKTILKDMLRWSTNLTAEVSGLAACQADGTGVNTLRDSAAAMSAWAQARFGTSSTNFVDHSGLGHQSRMSATDMVKALVEARKAGLLGPILKPIPMRDARGDVVANHPVKVRAKTGTLNFVSALAGYLEGPDGRDLAFAIFTADMDARDAIRESDGDIPAGTRAWNGRSRRLQQQLLERWGAGGFEGESIAARLP